ncbi:MFS transporter [Brevibacillus migulae]|uniref:MFS transporter n=1 Tax=Brevibacillus migulae TaxID=1644114 RepID=UPI00106DDF9B|nr:MFS transporter [Brevibacillus migulae]
MNITVFMEYKLSEEKRDSYFQQIEQSKQGIEARGGQNYCWYEAIEQPQLFVEMFTVDSYEQYEAIKAWRQNDVAFCEHIAGGAAKLHVWAFRPLEVS